MKYIRLYYFLIRFEFFFGLLRPVSMVAVVSLLDGVAAFDSLVGQETVVASSFVEALLVVLLFGRMGDAVGCWIKHSLQFCIQNFARQIKHVHIRKRLISWTLWCQNFQLVYRRQRHQYMLKCFSTVKSGLGHGLVVGQVHLQFLSYWLKTHASDNW